MALILSGSDMWEKRGCQDKKTHDSDDA